MTVRFSPFDPKLSDLPDVLPVFPLPGVLLLPGGRLPLNVFEPRYLNMVRDSLAGSRLIGMVQPAQDEERGFELEPGGDSIFQAASGSGSVSGGDVGSATVYRTGCAGRIVAFSETDDGRILLTLKGLIRFRIDRELPVLDGYRRVCPDFAAFAEDLAQAETSFDRDRLLVALRTYFEQHGIEADWGAIQEAPNGRLVTSLAMVCPFSPAEKQALLEAPDLCERAQMMMTILEMSVLGAEQSGAPASRH